MEEDDFVKAGASVKDGPSPEFRELRIAGERMSGLLVPERDLGRATSGALASGPEVSRILAGIVVRMELIFSSS